MSEQTPGGVGVGFRQVVIDCGDPRTLARFWASFTGYRIRSDQADWASIHSEDDVYSIGFQKVPEAKVVKNRVHVDFWADDEEATAVKIEALGARRRWVSKDPEDPFVVLADPEDNEFCIIRRS